MTPFDTAWSLLKDSASKEEYRADPFDEEGGFGVQDFDFGEMPRGGQGYAHFSPDRTLQAMQPLAAPNILKPWSFSRVAPRMPTVQGSKGGIFDNTTYDENGHPIFAGRLQELQAEMRLKRIGGHEAMHQALHNVKPQPWEWSGLGVTGGHEIGATIAEFDPRGSPDKKILERWRYAQSHPDINAEGKARLDPIIEALSRGKTDQEQAEIMGHRARKNAQKQIDMQGEVIDLEQMAESKEREIEAMWSSMAPGEWPTATNQRMVQHPIDNLYRDTDKLYDKIEALKRRIVKAPLYYPQEEELPPHIEGGPYPRDKALFPDLMSDLLAPAGFSDVSWESEDGLARGIAQQNWDTGQVNVHHFEVATPVRNGGLGESYLREMIAELEQEMAGQTELPQFHAHATKVEPEKAGFWDKMVDRGAISSASSRTNPRVTQDGKHFAPKISSDKLQPWEWPNEDEI